MDPFSSLSAQSCMVQNMFVQRKRSMECLSLKAFLCYFWEIVDINVIVFKVDVSMLLFGPCFGK